MNEFTTSYRFVDLTWIIIRRSSFFAFDPSLADGFETLAPIVLGGRGVKRWEGESNDESGKD